MKKLMWVGLSTEITVLVIMLLFIIFKKPVSGVLFGIFVAGMLICLISSLFVQRENIKESHSKQNAITGRKNILSYIVLLIPLIIILVITHFFV
ncbi:MAG: hypothetical protein E6929_17510 [Clostridium sp.]|nr:hypothetical protein [Clostridium sp.]